MNMYMYIHMYLDYKLLTSYFLTDDTVLHVANGIVIILLYVVYLCRLIEYCITYCFHEPNVRSEINRKIRKSNISYYSYSIYSYLYTILPGNLATGVRINRITSMQYLCSLL